MGPRKLGQTLPLWLGRVWLWFLKTRSPSSKTLGLTFLLNARLARHWYNYPWHIAIIRFSSIIFSCSYQEWAHLASDSSVWDGILKDGISTSTRRMASMPYTSEYGVIPIEVRAKVWYAHRANGKYSCESLYVSVIFTKIFFMFLFGASTVPFI